MDSFLKRQAGPTAHLWDMVRSDVFQPLGLFHAPMLHTQEADGGRGIPHLAHGLYLTIDDLAKLTTLLQNGGQHQGQQLLHAVKLAEALYKTAAMGLPTGEKNQYRRGTLSPVVLVGALSHRARLLLPDPLYGRGGWQSRHALAQRHLHLPDYRWVHLGPGSDGAGGGGHPTLPLSGGLAAPPLPGVSHSRRAPCTEMPGNTSTGTRDIFRWALVGAPPCLCRRWRALWHVHTWTAARTDDDSAGGNHA